MSLQLIHFSEVPSFTMIDGVEARPLFGEGAMLNLVTFEPGATVPLHSHPHEQLGQARGLDPPVPLLALPRKLAKVSGVPPCESAITVPLFAVPPAEVVA